MPRYLFATLQIARLLIRRYFRSRTAIFFSVFFPLIFLFIFGSLYGENNDTSFKVAVINQSDSQFAKTFQESLGKVETLEIQSDVTNEDDARQQMNRSELDAIIELPPQFGESGSQGYPSGQAKVLYDQTGEQAGQTVASIINGVLSGANAQITRITPPLTVAVESTATRGLSAFDYTVAGLLGFSLIGLGIFGPVNMLPSEKKTGALTRLRVTPLRPSQFIIAYMLSVLVTGLLSITIQLAVAIGVFHFHAVGSYLYFAVVMLLGAITIFGIGVAVGGWARDERQAAPLSNIVAFPLMFLSGTFFPRFLMPEWLQTASSYLPLTPVIDAIRLILTEGKNLVDVAPQIGLISIWAVVIYAVAFRIFRWE